MDPLTIAELAGLGASVVVQANVGLPNLLTIVGRASARLATGSQHPGLVIIKNAVGVLAPDQMKRLAEAGGSVVRFDLT